MTQDLVCEYCGTHYSAHQPHCSACGAALPRAGATRESAISSIVQCVREICQKYEDLGRCQMDESVAERKLRNARKAFRIAEDEKVIMLCDDTALGSNRLGFAICEGGVFWRNHWSLPTKRTRLTWSEFARREVTLEKNRIALGSGDAIGAQVMGTGGCLERLVDMFRDLRAAVGPLTAEGRDSGG
jgi:hypothetical protein